MQPQTPYHSQGATNVVLCSLTKPCRRLGLLNLNRMPHPSHEQSAAGARARASFVESPDTALLLLVNGNHFCQAPPKCWPLFSTARSCLFPKLQQICPESFKVCFVGPCVVQHPALQITSAARLAGLASRAHTAAGELMEEICCDRQPANFSCAPRWPRIHEMVSKPLF